MMQQHHSTIDQIFVYDNITEKAKYDLMYERQRVDRFQQEWKIWKWDANSNTTSQRRQSPPQHPTMNKMDKMNTSNTSTTIHQLQQENERLHQQLHDVSTQLQQSRTAAPPEELSTLKTSSTSSAPVLPASETAQQRQALELSLHEYKEYCKELEQQMEEQRLEHSNTVDILQQQVILLQESLQTTRQRLVTRDAEMDQMSSTFEQYKRSHHPLILQAPLSQHQQQYDANPEFPISPLSMTDSMVEGGRGGADQRCHHHFDTTTSTTITPPTTTTTPHTDTIVVIPQQQQHNQEHIFETTTTVPAAATTTENTMSVGVMPCSSVASSASIVRTNVNHYNHNTASSKSIISVTSSTTTLQYPRNATTMPQIRSDVDRAKAIEKLEYERIHNAMIVQQLRQSVLLQQQQQQVHCPPQPSQQ